ncbi:MAG TPA: fatty acid desaturase family protein [Pirellulales bacterium]|jgi:fatty acid desaturase|nr:fatty acid desaturase family protein [Pirellulales bacterium]
MHGATTRGLYRRRSPNLVRWLLPLGLDWTCIVLTFVLAGTIDYWAVYVLAIFVIGTRQHALAIMGHDGAHRLACRPRWLNDLVTVLFCFWPLGLGISAYRKHHFTHHRHPGTYIDPELAYKRSRAPQWDLPSPRRRPFLYFMKDIVGLGLADLVYVMLVVPPVRVMDLLGPLLWWTVALAVIISTGGVWILAVWFLALVTSFWAMFRLRIWTEHLGTGDVHRISAHWWQRLLFLPHNTWCHFEHHRWPTVPCWNLPAARALDQSTRIWRLAELLDAYRSSKSIASGEPLVELPTDAIRCG